MLDYHTIKTIQQATRITQKQRTLIDSILIANDSIVLDSGTIEVENNVEKLNTPIEILIEIQ